MRTAASTLCARVAKLERTASAYRFGGVVVLEALDDAEGDALEAAATERGEIGPGTLVVVIMRFGDAPASV